MIATVFAEVAPAAGLEAIGFLVLQPVGHFAVVTFLKWLEKLGLTPFAYYRIVLAIVFTLFVLFLELKAEFL